MYFRFMIADIALLYYIGCVQKLPVLKIYSAYNVNYRFSTLAVNFGTQPYYNSSIF